MKISRFTPAMALFLSFGLQCHSYAAIKDGGFVIYTGSQAGPVVFSHLSHGRSNAGFSCDRCHTAGLAVALNITMPDIRNGQACGICHNDHIQRVRGNPVTLSVGDCGSCHMPAEDMIFKLNRMDSVRFSHIKHLQADSGRKVSSPTGFSCRDCHPIPFDRFSKGSFRMEAPHDSGGCVKCHNARNRNDGMPLAFAANTRCLTCQKPSAVSPGDTQP